MIGYGDQLLYVLSWLAVLKLLQLSVWPALRPLFGRLAYPAAYTTSLLLLLLGSFYLGVARLPTWLAVVPFLVLLGAGIAKRWFGRAEWAGVARWDLVFLVFFLFVLELRFFNPYVSHYSEQFMDMAWIASIMRTPVVTPLDPWFAGGTLDIYYYLGHWLMAQLGMIAGVPARVVFNLVLPTVMAVSAVNCYLIGHILLERYRWLPLSLLVLVNPTAIHQLIIRGQLIPALDHARHAILHNYTEFPLFSMILGDPHALVMGMINQLFLIALLAFAWTRWTDLSSRQRWALSGLAALSLGAMPGINSWDVLVYGPLVVAVGLLLWWRHRSGQDATAARQALLFPVLVPCAAVLVYLPYLLQMQQGSVKGISMVLAPSSPVQFLMTLGFFFAVVAIAIASCVRRQPLLIVVAVPFVFQGYLAAAIAAVLLAYMLMRLRRTWRIEDLLVTAGLLIVLAVELVYIREALGGDSFRMNTMHKFYFIAWFLLGVGTTVTVGRWLSARPEPLVKAPAARKVAGLIAVAALLAFPIVFQPDVGEGLLGLRFAGGDCTLDGLAYLDYEHPGDAEAILFLETYPRVNGIVEAVGGDFDYGAPISSFTGTPTILGKAAHEFLWRTNDDGWWWTRIPDVQRIYEEPDQTVALMRQYGCELLYVGDLERQKYTVDLPSSGLEAIYDQGGVQIYRRAGA
jgi:YYY domain-containing protein